MNRLIKPLLFFCLLAPGVIALSQDYDQLIQQALAERDRGEFPQAEETLREAYLIPDDKSEVGGLLALVMAYQERYAEALELIEQLVRDYPDNEQLILNKARIHYYQGNLSDAERTLSPLVSRSNPNLEAAALSRQILAARQSGSDALPDETGTDRQQISIGYAQSTFDRTGLPDWHDRFAEYRLQRGANQWYVRGDHQHHFNLHDNQLTLGMVRHPVNRLPLEVFVSASSDAEFVADYRLGLSTRVTLPSSGQSGRQGTAILVPQYVFSSYGNGDTHRASLGLEYYLAETNAWLTPSIGMVIDQDKERSVSWGLGAHWQITETTRIGAGYSDAPETENLNTTETETLSAYIRQNLGQSLVLIAHAEYLDRENSYKRKGLGLTLQWLY